MTQLAAHDIGTLRAHLTGAVITPEDPGYDTARSVWNGNVDIRPAVIARCVDEGDVSAAVVFARDRGLELSVRGGSHNFGGACLVPDGLVVDLTEMRAVTVDEHRRTAAVGGGALWGEVDAATQRHGLAVPGGTVSNTGVGGLTLGGGFGWLTHRHGMTIDSLLSCDVVLADGSRVTASADEHPDLFWALRGGGGNFGVVTSFTFRLHQVGPEVHLAMLFWAVEDGPEVLRMMEAFPHTQPESAALLCAVGMNAPPMDFVPDRFRFALGHAMLVAGFGTAAEHAASLAPLEAGPRPLFQMRTPLPYTALQQVTDGSVPAGILGYEKGLILPEFSEDAVRVIGEHITRKTSPRSFCPVMRLDGAMCAIADEDTAYGGERSPAWLFNIAALSDGHAALEADRAWARAFWDDLAPFARTGAAYVNFMTHYAPDRVRGAYGPKYDRLSLIKAHYDPDNVFHRNPNVVPAL